MGPANLCCCPEGGEAKYSFLTWSAPVLERQWGNSLLYSTVFLSFVFAFLTLSLCVVSLGREDGVGGSVCCVCLLCGDFCIYFV